jgi:hypothetical protein
VKPRGRRLLLGLAGVAVVALSPLLLREMAFFRVRRVEVVGARFLEPERIVDALALADGQNLFDPLGEARRRADSVPGVVRARLSRRVPGTLRVTVVEEEPVALAPGRAGMVPLDCEAGRLPYDPAHAGLALPIVERADSLLVRALCVVRAADAALYASVEAVRAGGGGSVILELEDQRVRLNGTPSTGDVAAVVLVRQHLEATGQAFAELDARYHGLVYARGRRS